VYVTLIEGPTGTQTASKSKGHREPTQGPTEQPPEKAQAEVGSQGVGRPHRSFEPTLWRLIRAFHMVLPGLSLTASRGCLQPFHAGAQAYK
jgi:hypothetical protein